MTLSRFMPAARNQGGISDDIFLSHQPETCFFDKPLINSKRDEWEDANGAAYVIVTGLQEEKLHCTISGLP